ncbi:hypothetical protein ASG90_09330 [Nocardioides sp. Soil797]|nr:hypothetical protein ASG90_09330 [Nocardioides sp. Soil797]
MNDLRDLRETLHSHADLHDTASTTRAAAIHDRIRGVRRRRRAVVGGAVVAAVAAVAVGLNLPSNDGPDPAVSDGLDAPRTITSTGYTFDLESTTVREHKASVAIPKSDVAMLVAWGTEAGADDPVRVNTPDDGPTVSAAAPFENFYIVYPGESARISVSEGEGKVSLATYALGDSNPAGVTRDGITFRQDVGVWDLVDGEISDQGAPELTFEVTLPQDGLVRVADLCMGLPKGYWVNTSIDGKGLAFSNHTSCNETGYDPANGSYSVSRVAGLGKPGATVPVRMWVSRSMEGEEPVDATDLTGIRLGLAFYGVDPAYPDTTMSEPEAVVESGGHTWHQTRGFAGSGPSPLVQQLDGKQAHLVMINYRTSNSATYRVSADGRELDSLQTTGAKEGGFGEILVPPGAKDVTVEIVRGGSRSTQTSVAVYDRAD